MSLRWKLIIFELILEILIELAPGTLSLMATVAQYLLDLSLESSGASVQLVASSIAQETYRRSPVMNIVKNSLKA